MTRLRDGSALAMVAGLMVVGTFVAGLRPSSHDEHQQQVFDLFELSEDSAVLGIRSGWQRGGNEYVGAAIQLSDADYERLAQPGGDLALVPIVHDDVQVGTETEPGWNGWHDGDLAVIVALDESPHGARTRELERALKRAKYKAITWADWVYVHDVGEGESVWDVEKRKSFCWAYAQQDGKKAVRACTAYPPTQWHPEVFVRATLDQERKRLFVTIN